MKKLKNAITHNYSKTQVLIGKYVFYYQNCSNTLLHLSGSSENTF